MTLARLVPEVKRLTALYRRSGYRCLSTGGLARPTTAHSFSGVGLIGAVLIGLNAKLIARTANDLICDLKPPSPPEFHHLAEWPQFYSLPLCLYLMAKWAFGLQKYLSQLQFAILASDVRSIHQNQLLRPQFS